MNDKLCCCNSPDQCKYLKTALDFQQPSFLMVSTETPMFIKSVDHPDLSPLNVYKV